MSFAIIQTGGKQYKVSASEIIKIERLNDEEGKTVEFKNVLLLTDDKNTEIGSPTIKGARVEAKILKNTKNKTILVFKKRRRKNSRKRYGHRQPISLIQITKIFSGDGKLLSESKETKKNVPAKKEEKLAQTKENTKLIKPKTQKNKDQKKTLTTKKK